MDGKKETAKEMICRIIARDVAEIAQNEIADKLRETDIQDAAGIMQAQTCHLLSAFFLSITIKILQMNKIKENTIEHACDTCIELAHEFAEIGKFKVEREH